MYWDNTRQLKASKNYSFIKQGDTNYTSNYRPIAIIPIFAKLLEKIVHQRLHSFLQLHDIFIDEQFGF